MTQRSPYTRGLWADLARGFQGPGRGLAILVFVDILVVFVLCILMLVGLFDAVDTHAQIVFGVFFLACLQAVGLLKMWFFHRLDRLAILDALAEIRERQDR